MNVTVDPVLSQCHTEIVVVVLIIICFSIVSRLTDVNVFIRQDSTCPESIPFFAVRNGTEVQNMTLFKDSITKKIFQSKSG